MSEPFARFARTEIGYGRGPVIADLSLNLPRGRITAFCGPNGSGKSTALKALRRLIGLSGGAIEVAGRPLAAWPAKALAREMAMLGQAPSAPQELTVRELAMLGRFAHRTRFGGPAAEDVDAVSRALALCDLSHRADDALGALSGGQLQRAWIAMVIAQDAPVILLDEPTNHLDVAHAHNLLSLVARLNQQDGRTIVMVLHDLNLAARHADNIVLWRDGQVVAEGTAESLFRPELIGAIFEVECTIMTDPRTGRPLCLTYPRANIC
ncbi:MAG: ABC transporter ATP-binding protein [Pseudomonadota bacterium]